MDVIDISYGEEYYYISVDIAISWLAESVNITIADAAKFLLDANAPAIQLYNLSAGSTPLISKKGEFSEIRNFLERLTRIDPGKECNESMFEKGWTLEDLFFCLFQTGRIKYLMLADKYITDRRGRSLKDPAWIRRHTISIPDGTALYLSDVSSTYEALYQPVDNGIDKGAMTEAVEGSQPLPNPEVEVSALSDPIVKDFYSRSSHFRALLNFIATSDGLKRRPSGAVEKCKVQDEFLQFCKENKCAIGRPSSKKDNSGKPKCDAVLGFIWPDDFPDNTRDGIIAKHSEENGPK